MSQKAARFVRAVHPNRRSVLRALGAGATISLVGGVAAADEHADGNGDGNGENGTSRDKSCGEFNRCSPCLDPITGWATLAADDTAGFDPDHTVEMNLEAVNVLFAPTESPPMEAGNETVGNETVGNGTATDGMDGLGFGPFPDFFFDPVGLRVSPGDVVEFPNVSDDLHTVTAYAERFFGAPNRIPDGAAPFSSPPVMTGENWLYEFTEEGVYDIQCLPHEFLGMVMRVVVLDSDSEDVPEVPDLAPPEEGGPSPIPATVLSTPELAVSNIVDEGSVAWADLTIEEQIDPSTLEE